VHAYHALSFMHITKLNIMRSTVIKVEVIMVSVRIIAKYDMCILQRSFNEAAINLVWSVKSRRY
jgi:hypothetical protein